MKILNASCLLASILSAAPALAAQPSPPHANNPVPKPHISSPASTHAMAPVTKAPESSAQTAAPSAPATPSPAGAPAASLSLDAYIADLTDNVPLSKNEQTDIKTYYLDDGAKLQSILNDASLSPLAQQQQIDDLRDARNSKIQALLADVGRQAQFLKLENSYRVALVELAAKGGLVPTTPPPNVPQPTATAPADAAKSNPSSPRADAAPGQ